MVLEMLFYSPFNRFTHLLAREYFVNVCVFLSQENMLISLPLIQLV